ncbi:hypothetical protein PsorP6_001387 [Peronosclerospora sorghi]|uniref:Uncharacterized protein n=1 Tax=Peronosclerospora sorghi TaxID=230839 RepID=A0ACC0WQS0_9STRA|nr:hypothetical protein PsorP6_001387 [Peronosclerospora sorghi]
MIRLLLTASELSCPGGTYQSNYEASNLSACFCPKNMYHNILAQQDCFAMFNEWCSLQLVLPQNTRVSGSIVLVK